MKKSYRITALALICALLVSVVILSSCGGEQPSAATTAEITTGTPEVTTAAEAPEITAVAGLELNGDALTAEAAADDATFIVSGKIRVTKGAEWFVSTDAEGANKVEANVCTVAVGENNFFVTVTLNGQKKVYTLKITRPEGAAITEEITNVVGPDDTTAAGSDTPTFDPKTYRIADKGDGEIVDFPS